MLRGKSFRWLLRVVLLTSCAAAAQSSAQDTILWQEVGQLPSEIGGYNFTSPTVIAGDYMYAVDMYGDGSTWSAPLTDLSVSNWTHMPSLQIAANHRANFALASHGSYLYAVGGSPVGTNSARATVEYAMIDGNGGLATPWSATSSMNTNRHTPGVTAHNGRLYTLGGMPNGTEQHRSVEFATINADGTLGGWTNGPSMSAGRSQTSLTVANNRLYAFGGGVHGASSPTSEFASITGSGLGAWSAPSALPDARKGAGAVTLNNDIHLIGGHIGTSGNGRINSVISTDASNTTGVLGPWVANSPLPSTGAATAVQSRAQVVGNHIYATSSGKVYKGWSFDTPSWKPLPRNYEPSEPDAPISRLARWDNQQQDWIPLSTADAGTITAKKIHVMTHGHAPNQIDWVEEQSGVAKVWEMRNAPNEEQAGYFTSFDHVAASISQRYENESTNDFEILAFNWVDQSASPGVIFAYWSRRDTDEMGGALAQALQDAGVAAAVNSGGQLHMMGHSHGARVMTWASSILESSGTEVTHLTLWDSPEGTPADNDLHELFPHFLVNSGETDVFVDNYVSQVGSPYNSSSNEWNLTDVQFDSLWLNNAEVGRHGYPVDWYAAASTPETEFALSWSPLFGGDPSILAKQYSQSAGDEFLLVPDTHVQDDLPEQSRTANYFSVGTEGGVTDLANGKKLEENNPAYWDLLFETLDHDVALEFDYEFLKPGDGDQLGVWIDGELFYILTGAYAPDALQQATIDISHLEPGIHLLTYALHSTGDPNAELFISDPRMMSVVPEPTSLVLLGAGYLLIGTRRRVRLSQASAA